MKKYFHFIFLFAFMLPSSAQNTASINVSAGKMIRYENFNSKYTESRNVDVWLPSGYNPQKKYNVLYMQDGQMLFDSISNWNHQEWCVDETMSKLLQEKKIHDCIIVGIWNSGKNRHSDYCPEKPFESLTPAQQDTLLKTKRKNGAIVFAAKPNSDNYLKFLVTELKPFIDSVYSTNKNQQQTFIAGSSMGALISVYAICEYPQVFGAAACLSTHWPVIYTNINNSIADSIYSYLKANLPSPKNHKIYFDYGTTTLDTLYEPYQKRVDVLMKQKGFTSKNWITKRFEGADHSEKAWRNRLNIPLQFLLKD